MTRFVVSVIALAVLMGAFAPAAAETIEAPHLKLVTVEGAFEDVKQDVANAIADKGFVVDYTGHVGSMLKRTAKDIGATKVIYDAAQYLQFCSAVYSRQAVEADPSNIVFCPFVIVIYTLSGKPDTVYVGYRKPVGDGSPASQKALRRLETLLDEIVNAATE